MAIMGFEIPSNVMGFEVPAAVKDFEVPAALQSMSYSQMGLAVGTAVLGYIVAYGLYSFTLHPLAKYPGPLAAKFTNLYAVYHAFIGDLHLDMLRCHEKYGEIVRYGPNKVILNSTTAIQPIYGRQANVQKSTAYRAFETSPTAHDLQSTVNKATHARKRRVMSQAFSETALRSLENHVLDHVNSFVRWLSMDDMNSEEKPTPGVWAKTKDIAKGCSYVSFDLMAELVFGKAFHMLEVIDNRFILDLIQVAAFRVGVCLQMPSLAVWQVDKIFTPKVRELRDQYVGVSRKMATERMNMDSTRTDLFTHILAAKDPQTGKGFTTDELWGESTLLIVAGSDAISTGMAGCFYYFGREKEIYKKAVEEVRSVFSSPEEIRTGPKMNACNYLRACVDESMRMSPPVGGALWREVCEGGVTIDGNFVHKGADIGIGIYAIHHNPEYFPEPFKFKPERWIVGNGVTQEQVDVARTAFQAFSIGPVGCLGKNLAYMEMMNTMARVLYSLDLKTDSEAPFDRPQILTEKYLDNYKEHSAKEYKLRDRFTSYTEGPMMSFRVRQD